MAKNHFHAFFCFARISSKTYFLHQGFHALTMENVLFYCPMPFLSFLSQRYHYILVERNIELDISNRKGDASATAAASIHPIGNFLRSWKQNNSFSLRTYRKIPFKRKCMVIQICIKTFLRWQIKQNNKDLSLCFEKISFMPNHSDECSRFVK